MINISQCGLSVYSFEMAGKFATVVGFATLTGAWWWWSQHRSVVKRLQERINVERKGRIRAEQELRNRSRRSPPTMAAEGQQTKESDASSLPSTWTFSSIATARSLFVDRRGCPRQGSLAPAAIGFLEVAKHIPPAAFDGLEDFSHIWVTFVFDRNTNFHKPDATQKTFKAKIRAPLLGGKRKVGLFATRSPHRPNAIGLTLCKLERLDRKLRRVYLSGIDLCDGTPVLDIKPYNPHDRPLEPTYAAWVPIKSEVGDRGAPLRTEYQPAAEKQLRELLPRLQESGDAASRLHFNSFESATEVIRQVLRLDVRGLKQKRGGNGGTWEVRLGKLRISFSVQEGVLWINSCSILKED